MHSAVQSLKAWAEDPHADLPSCAMTASERARRSSPSCAAPDGATRRSRRAVLEIEAHAAERGLGPAGAAVRAGRHRRAGRPRAGAGRGDGAGRGRRRRVADPGRAGRAARRTSPREAAGSRSCGRRRWPAAPRSSSGWCCRPTATSRCPRTRPRPSEFAARAPRPAGGAHRRAARPAAARRTARCGCVPTTRTTSVVDGPDLVPALLELLRSHPRDRDGDAERAGERTLRRRPRRRRRAGRRARHRGARGRCSSPLVGAGRRVLPVSVFAGIWTDRLWFGSVGYAEVFSTVLWTGSCCSSCFGAADGRASSRLNIYLAYRLRPLFRPALARAGQPGPLPRGRRPRCARWLLIGGQRAGRPLRRRLRRRPVAHVPAVAAPACRSARPTRTSTRTSASTSSPCRGCTTWSTS